MSKHVKIDPLVFDFILKEMKLNRQTISDPKSKYYCGISRKTLYRAMADGYFSKQTFNKLNSQIDISKCVIDDPHKEVSDYRAVIINSKALKSSYTKLQYDIDRLSQDLLDLEKVINDILSQFK